MATGGLAGRRERLARGGWRGAAARRRLAEAACGEALGGGPGHDRLVAGAIQRRLGRRTRAGFLGWIWAAAQCEAVRLARAAWRWLEAVWAARR